MKRTRQRCCPAPIPVSGQGLLHHARWLHPSGGTAARRVLPRGVCFCPSCRSPVLGAVVSQQHQVHGRVEWEVCHQVAKNAKLTAQLPLGTCCWVGKGVLEVGAARSCLPAVRTSRSCCSPAQQSLHAGLLTHTQPICTTGAQETCSIRFCDLISLKNLLALDVETESIFTQKSTKARGRCAWQ